MIVFPVFSFWLLNLLVHWATTNAKLKVKPKTKICLSWMVRLILYQPIKHKHYPYCLKLKGALGKIGGKIGL